MSHQSRIMNIIERMEAAVLDADKTHQGIEHLRHTIEEIKKDYENKTNDSHSVLRCFDDTDPNSDVHQWCQKFMDVMEYRRSSISKMVSALKVYLTGSVRDWLEAKLEELNYNEAEIDQYEDNWLRNNILKPMCENFDRENAWLSDHTIHFMMKKPNETTQSFYGKLVKKCKRLNKSDNEIANIFVKALPAVQKIFVLAKHPTGLSEYLRYAKEYEALHVLSSVSSDSGVIAAVLGEEPMVPVGGVVPHSDKM